MCLTRTNIWLLTSFFCYRGEELSDFKRFGWIPRDPTWLESAVSALVRVVKEILHDSRPQLRGVPVIFFLSTSVERMVSIIRYSKPVESNHLSEDMGLILVLNCVILSFDKSFVLVQTYQLWIHSFEKRCTLLWISKMIQQIWTFFLFIIKLTHSTRTHSFIISNCNTHKRLIYVYITS